MGEVIIVGGGAAGMLAAVSCARQGKKVSLYEKNEKLGKKLFITGKGRCNITNACDAEDFLDHVVGNPRFLYSAFYNFTNLDMMELLTELGLPLKTERGNRVFPKSDKSSDVIKVLSRELQRLGVEVFLNTPVKDIIVEDGSVRGILLNKGERRECSSVLIATGGLS